MCNGCVDVMLRKIALKQAEDAVGRYEAVDPCALAYFPCLAKHFYDGTIRRNSKLRHNLFRKAEKVGKRSACKRYACSAEKDYSPLIPSPEQFVRYRWSDGGKSHRNLFAADDRYMADFSLK